MPKGCRAAQFAAIDRDERSVPADPDEKQMNEPLLPSYGWPYSSTALSSASLASA